MSIRRCYLFIILFIPYLAAGQNVPQEEVYNFANETLIIIQGTDRNFTYQSDKFAGRYDKNQNFFEFILPATSVYSLDEANDIEVARNILLINKGQPVLNLTASFNDPLINVEDFKSPQEVLLDGWLTFNEQRYNIPVVMSLYFLNGVLFYKLRTEIDMYELNWRMPVHYRKFLTGKLMIQVNDGQWRNFNVQRR